MQLVKFSELLQRVDNEGLTEAVISDLNDNGAVDDSGNPVDATTTSFVLIGFRISRNGNSWMIANV